MKPNPPGVARLLVLIALAVHGCAREETPPGTAPDFEAPRVVEMFPPPGAAVPDLDRDAYVRFDEPLGDPRSVARVVETSPAWDYEIRAGRQAVRIRPRDGWRPGVVYTFRIPPGLRDLVRNQTREPIEFLFSTGSDFVATRTEGVVWDRETVRTVRDVAVQVIGGDSVPYAAVTDTAGRFELRGLPVGYYWAFAFRDQNRNRRVERDFEPHDSGLVALPTPESRVQLELWLTAPDSTPPALGVAQALDSLTVRLEFDDLLEPEAPLDAASVRVFSSATGEEWPVAQFVLGAMAAQDSTPGESTEPDSAVADAAAVLADSLRAVEEAIEGGEAGADGEAPSLPTRARPERFVSVRLVRPLDDGTFRVSARGFTNLRLLSGGGDTTFVYEPPPPGPEPEPAEGSRPEPSVDEGAEAGAKGEEPDGADPPMPTEGV